MIVQDERPEDHPATEAVHRAAFGGAYEAGVVARLRRSGRVAASLVAREGAEVVGHILFSRLDVVVEGRAVDAVALAPLAVRPDRQGLGVGSALVTEGLARLRAQGRQAVLVRGHPGWYPRFGFSAALIRHLDAPFRGESYMGLELMPGALRGAGGTVRYPPEFQPG